MRSRIKKASRVSGDIVAVAVAMLLAHSTVVAALYQQAQPNAETRQNEIRRLELGKQIEREMKGGESHTYEITFEANQYFSGVVEQKGIDVVVQVMAPDGKQLLEVDSPNGTQGDEPFRLITETSGNYRLLVRSLEKAAPSGRYKIRLAVLRAAQAADRASVEVKKLNQQVETLLQQGKYNEGVLIAERSLSIGEKEFGAEHPDVAASLNNLAELYRYKGDYAKAEPLYQRAVAVFEKTLGPDDPDLATSVSNLGVLYQNKGDYGKAEPLYQRALAIREKTLGKDHPDVAQSLNNLAELYRVQGNYAQAEPLFQRALATAEKALGKEHPDVAISLNTLALLYQAQGDYGKAEPLFQRSLAIFEKALGKDHPTVAVALNNFARFYREKGDYTKAEPLFQRSLAVYEKAFGKEHPEAATVLNNLARVYEAKGDYGKAEPLYQRALAIREKTLGKDHPNVAISLNNLALLYQHNGDYVKPEPLYQRALSIYEKAIGKDNPDLATTLNNLATLYRDRNDYAKAELVNQRALAIREKALGAGHPDVAGSLNNLALLYSDQGDYAKAEPLYQRSLAILEEALGKDHPTVAQSLNNLAILYQAQGNTRQAISFQSRSNDSSERDLTRNLAAGSERQKITYLNRLLGITNQTLSLHLQSAPNNPEARDLACTTLLQRKGRSLDLMTDAIAALRRRASTDDLELLNQLTQSRTEFSSLTLKGPGREGTDKYRAARKEVEDKVDDLESKISLRNAEFRTQTTSITLDKVQKAIPTNTALVEFAAYRPYNAKESDRKKQYGDPRYAVYVLRNQSEPTWAELGDAGTIDAKIDTFRKALRNKRSRNMMRLARAVDAVVMQPVRKLLGSTRRVFLSPDGALNLVPFAALVDEHSQYLVKRYSFTYLTSGRDLLRLQTKVQGKTSKMVIADPDFGKMKTSQSSEPSAGELDDLYFLPLRATEAEARDLQRLFPDATVLIKDQATEAALKAVDRPAILHIATHGFFLNDEQQLDSQSEGDKTRMVVRRRERLPVKREDDPSQLINPLLRSGLALAGANQRTGSDGNDGILTALEAAGLDLWGTKLVVLSACDTGVGQVKTGDGVYGLRRSLVLAGSESQLMSLWPVSDTGTHELMIDYYKRLKAQEGRSEALRRVQLKMLANPRRSHPFYWASFIQSGEWANLDGKRVD